MDEEIRTTIETYDRRAAALLAGPPPAPDDDPSASGVEAFVMRTGRPLPKVLVLGARLAARCMVVEQCGGVATGVDAAMSAVLLARRLYPQGRFLQADLRDLPLESASLDGVWTERVLSHIPNDGIADALADAHRTLRPGGLLYARLPLGNQEGYEETEHGRMYRARRQVDDFAKALSALDFNLIENRELPDHEAALVFRREY